MYDLSKINKEIFSAKSIVKHLMQNFDASHDFNHVERVYNNALLIASSISKYQTIDIELVLFGAIFHDVFDHKYGVSNYGTEKLIQDFFDNYFPNKWQQVKFLIKNVSWSQQIKNEALDNPSIMN